MSDVRYDGTYRAVVVDNLDPTEQRRLRVQVPELDVSDLGWAQPSLPPGEIGSVPNVGDELWVMFEAGSVERPVWQVDQVYVGQASHHHGYGGVYRGVVVDNADPEGRSRLRVQVPDVNADGAWAEPAAGLTVSEPPAVGAEVWIEYEAGDPDYPRWVGVAGG